MASRVNSIPTNLSFVGDAEIEKEIKADKCDKQTLIAVLQFLKINNLKDTEEIFKKETGLNDEDVEPGTMSASEMSDDLAVYKCDDDPSLYDNYYINFKIFIDSCLDVRKDELATILYPVFVHMYLELVYNGHESHAKAFFNKFSFDQEEYYSEDLEKLSTLTKAEHMKDTELMEDFKSSRSVLNISRDSYTHLEKYLQEKQLNRLLNIIQEHLYIDVFDAIPRTTHQNDMTGGRLLAAAAREANKTKVFHGLKERVINIPDDDDVDDSDDVAGGEEDEEEKSKIPTIDQPKKKQKRQYDPDSLKKAYQDVIDKKMSVYRAARVYNIPESTLRDRTLGLQPVNENATDLPPCGSAPTLSREEELQLVKHISYMTSIGYGYTKTEFLNLATDFAISVGKKKSDDASFGASWFAGFKHRNPGFTVSKHQKQSIAKAKCSSNKAVDKYFVELERVLRNNDLTDSPGNIWNINETRLVIERNSDRVACMKGATQHTDTSNKGNNFTVIGCGNAAGMRLPPFFVFPGKRWRDNVLQSATPGSSGCVSESGHSNSTVFMNYLENHFKKFVSLGDTPSIVLFDGHKSHMSLTLEQWGETESNNVVFFALPPHTSGSTHPSDVGCFGQLKLAFGNECQFYMRNYPGMQINRYTAVKLASKAYNMCVTPENLISSFEKTGILPLQRKYNTCSEEKTTRPSIYIDRDEIVPESAFLDSKKFNYVKKTGSKRKNLLPINSHDISPSKHPLFYEIPADNASNCLIDTPLCVPAYNPPPGTSGH